MTTAAKQIVSSLNEVFAPMDAEVLASSLVWIEERAAALNAFVNSAEYDELRRKDVTRAYDRRFAIAGGKGWHNVIMGSNAPMRAEAITKNCAAVAAKRNATIAAKLVKADVTAVTETTYTRTTDGFDGVFRVETNKGNKVVKVNTIRAGGYNIQCLHLRVLTTVK